LWPWLVSISPSEIPCSLILDILLTACFFLEFLHTFAFKRLDQMHPLERPLWYCHSPIPTFYILVLALLFWPVLISTFVWGLLHFPWWRVVLECLVGATLAGLVEPRFPAMLAVLLAGTPSTLLAITLWFL